ncbi:MAG TPA: helix-hairpin-helix domain-containing protein [Syntrophaceae bacterium]|nr:helix-hairpin-helix domain-containing protein [Syntrophaceae bacterium]
MRNRKLTVFLILATLICVFLTLPALATEKKVNINTATAEELMTLKGIGEKKAHAIIEYREAHGPFESIDDLKNVKGIGDKIFESIKSEIMVEE